MSVVARCLRAVAATVALAGIAAVPAAADTTVRDYAVELIDRQGRIVATGRMNLAITAGDDEGNAHRIDGTHHFDRKAAGAPALLPDAGVHGRIRNGRVSMSLRVFPLERVRVHARFDNAQRHRLVGEWRYAGCFRAMGGLIHAYAVNPDPGRP
jgi:hypothetical protein